MFARRTRSEAVLLLVGLVPVLVLLFLPIRAAAEPDATDPIQALKDALVLPPQEPNLPAALALREEVLRERISRLTSVEQLRQALQLTGWKDDPRENPRLRTIDLEARRKIADRMLASLKSNLEPQSPPDVRLAAATFVGELDTQIRSAAALDHKGLAREMTGSLAKVVETDADSRVRRAAARALGKINPDPAVAARALQVLLTRQGSSQAEAVAEKRAAASALLDMIQVASRLYKTNQTQRGVLATPGEVVETAGEVVAVAGLTTGEADARVRRLCVAALHQSATAVAQVIPDPFLKTDFPTRPNRRNIRLALMIVKEEQELLLPVMKGLQNQAQFLTTALGDEDAEVRILASNTLEKMALARRRLLDRLGSVPPL